jgi:hypothetical protein
MTTTGPYLGHVPTRARTGDLRIKSTSALIGALRQIALLRAPSVVTTPDATTRTAPEHRATGPQLGLRRTRRQNTGTLAYSALLSRFRAAPKPALGAFRSAEDYERYRDAADALERHEWQGISR